MIPYYYLYKPIVLYEYSQPFIFVFVMKSNSSRGSVVEEVIRNSGYTLVSVARRLGISRTTLYNRFKENYLSDVFLFELGKAINHDFTEDFEELRDSDIFAPKSERKFFSTISTQEKDMVEIQAKYYRALEDYNKLLRFMIKVANENNLHDLKREISNFVKDSNSKPSS